MRRRVALTTAASVVSLSVPYSHGCTQGKGYSRSRISTFVVAAPPTIRGTRRCRTSDSRKLRLKPLR